MIGAVHAAATIAKKFQELLKSACRNYTELWHLGLVEHRRLRREKVEEIEDTEKKLEALEAVDRYDKLVEGFEKLARSKAFQEYKKYTDEPFIKWAGKSEWTGFGILSVGYLGLRERAAERFIIDFDVPCDLEDLYELYDLHRFEEFRIPSQEESERLLLQFLEYLKGWPRERMRWLVEKLHPLVGELGFWRTARWLLAIKSLESAWDDFLRREEEKVKDELMKTPQFKVLEEVFGHTFAWSYVWDLIPEVRKEIAKKYAEVEADPEKVREELFSRAKEVFSERIPSREKVDEVLKELEEQVRQLVWPEDIKPAMNMLRKEVYRASLYPKLTAIDLARDVRFDLATFARPSAIPILEEKAKEIASKIVEAARRPAIPPEELEKRKREEELKRIRDQLGRLEKLEKLAFFVQNREKWEHVTESDLKEILREIVRDWTRADYQAFYDKYPEKERELAAVFSALGLPAPPPHEVPKTIEELRRELEEERLRRREAERRAEEERVKAESERARAEALAKAVEVAPPPIKEPVAREETVVRRECYDYFSRLWDEIKRAAAMEVGIPTVSSRMGVGADLIRKALSYAYWKQVEKIERLANELIECQCRIELEEKRRRAE